MERWATAWATARQGHSAPPRACCAACERQHLAQPARHVRVVGADLPPAAAEEGGVAAVEARSRRQQPHVGLAERVAAQEAARRQQRVRSRLGLNAA